ncbi:MAG: isocitrate/isopropylmalate dehydrogenase family protein [Caldilineaceae bacterium]|nr:isocitrate/isopropylmalate dehydrogenase family protein [Caldilineaceae bacterium]
MERRRLRIALIPGDGIGREVVPAAQRVLDAAGVAAEYLRLDAGFETFQRTGNALPPATVEGVRSCDGALFGAVSSPSTRTPGYVSPILTLRKELDLFANVRPALSAPVTGSQEGIDFVIVRENTECLYVKQEREEKNGARVVAERVITRRASARVTQTACEIAMRRAALRGEQKALLTVVHKANVLALSDGLFRTTALDVAEGYAGLEVEEQLVDSMVYRMIREPQRYDVVVAPNLYGDILSDAAAALVGGLGLAPSANVGDGYVLAEPVHGSAPDIGGKGIANPVATIRAAALLLEQLGQGDIAKRIENAVDAVLSAGVWTADLGGQATTEDVTEAVCVALQAERSVAIRR